MSTINSVTFTGTQRNPTLTIRGSGFGGAPTELASRAGSGMTGFNYGMSLFVSDLTQNFSAGIATSATNNSVGLLNLSYSDTAISFQFGSAYSMFLYNFKPADTIGLTVNGTSLITSATFVPPITQLTLGVARFFSTGDGTHFFTSDPGEVQQILQTRTDLVEETGFGAIDPAANDPNAVLVYRFFDSVYGSHFFTSSVGEKNQVQATRPDLKFEGVAFSEHATPQAGDSAVYRYFDTRYGTHFFSSDPAENSTILATRPDLKPEGIAFYQPT